MWRKNWAFFLPLQKLSFMKLGILHFTDSHIKSATDWILSEFSSLVASVKTIYEECDRIYIVFTGDVVYSGSEEEYILASKF